jgi:hypothetical protein
LLSVGRVPCVSLRSSTIASGFAAAPYADGIEYAGVAVTYAELAAWITRLENVARRLLAAPD